MKNLKFFFACLLLTAFSIGQMWGADPSVRSTFSTSSTITDNKVTENGVTWTLDATVAAGEPTITTGTASSTQGLKFGSSGSNYFSPIKFTTDYFKDYNVKSVTIYEKNNGSKIGTLTVKQGSITIGTSSHAAKTSDWATLTASGTKGEGGTLEVTYEVAQASYFNYIEVVYEEGGSSCTSEITITKADNPAEGSFTLDNSGTVCIDEGNAIVNVTATPNTGYHLATVVSAEGTIGDIEGNSCQITNIGASTTISVTFAEDPKYTVSFNVGGSAATIDPIQETTAGAGITLPAGPTPTCEASGWSFAGWKETSAVDEETTTAPTLLDAGTNYKPAANCTLYAVYKQEAGSAPGTSNYTITFGDNSTDATSDISAADFLNYITENKSKVSSVSSIVKCYKGEVGLKLSSKKNNGSFVLTLSESTAITKVILNTKKKSLTQDASYELTVGSTAFSTSSALSKDDFVDVEFTGTKTTSNSLSIASLSSTNEGSNSDGRVAWLKSIKIYYEGTITTYNYLSTPTCVAPAVETPTFSVAAGTYTSVQSVELSCETDGATIYYTTDGSTPDNTKTEYTSAISVDETMTIKAIAIKESESSAVATATYTINLPLSTMDAIFAAATTAGGTATDVNITFGNWVVSGVSTNGKNVFVTDGTKGLIIFNSGGGMGFAVGDVLSGTAACKVQLYNGAAELTTLSSTTEGLSVTTGGVITPEVKAISALGGINTGAPITINSVQFDGTNLSDGANSIKPYNSLCAYDDLENGKYYNVTGIYLQFGATKEILPRSNADIAGLTLDDPELSYSPASATIELGGAWSAPTFNNPHSLTPITFLSSNTDVATVDEFGEVDLVATAPGTATITASFAGNATYAAGNATYTITVNPASVTENVVILALYETKYYAMSTNNASSAFTAIAVEYDGSQVTVNSAEDKAAIQWTKKTSGDNTTFQDADEKYMKSADGTSMSLQDAVCNWIWDEGGFYKISGTTRTFFYQNGTGFKNFATSNFNKSGYSDKADVIVIDPANIVITSKVSAELAYDPTSDVITQGDAWSAPTLVNPHSVTITSYATDNDAVATVTDGGVIALAGGIGTAHITAHFDGDASYLEGDAVYTITVNAPAPVPSGTTYRKVTVTGDITDGEYLIVYEGDATHDAYAFNGSLANVDQAMKGVAVTINEGVIAGTTTIDAATFTIDVTAGTLRSASGWYIGRTENSNGMEKDETTEYVNTFAIDGGKAVITSSGGPTLRYNYASDQLRFRYYKSGQQAIQLYKKETPTPAYTDVRTGLTPNHYYTICYPKAMTDIQGATLWSFVGKDANFAYLVQETATTIEAGKPYIMYATASTVTAVLGDETNAPGANGAIHGTFSSLTQVQLNNYATVAGSDLYLVIGDELRRATGASTSGNTLPANRAFVVVGEIPNETPAQMPGRQVRSMGLPKDTPTGIDNAEASEKPVKKLVNGQLFILRGEKMYDAKGQLVK